MQLNEVRKRFLRFMEKRGHAIVSSAPIVPQEDTTTLFTGSGMQPLLPFLLGQPHPSGPRVADSQKCFRANDIEEVGDNRHTTFFEMLGNWSFGDYFKEEQIKNCFTFLTDKEEGLGLDPSKLYVTVFAGDADAGIPKDDVAVEVWEEVFASVGIEAGVAHIGSQEEGDIRGMQEGERIFFYDASKNWWSRSGSPASMPVGEPGGPDTEVFYDFGEEFTDPAYAHLQPHPNTDSGRFIEICNSVFMEYIHTEKGFEQLPKKNIDFGGGLERLVAATEHNPDIFYIDVFFKLITALEEKSQMSYTDTPKPFRVVSDHLRSALFIIADGVTPSNTDRGYVLRRLIREAVFNLRYELHITEVSLSTFSSYIISSYGEYYPELESSSSTSVLEDEEKKFLQTLEKGMKILTPLLENKLVTGLDVFKLQSTYGFPKELTLKLASEHNITVSLKEYDTAMEMHKKESREGSEQIFKGGLQDESEVCVRYHTATHLLHQALRDVLGDSVMQKGSNITSERMRFDFTHGAKMTDEEKEKVEAIVNEKIKEALPITYEDMSVEDAKKLGAIGLFEYGDKVRVYSVGEYSKEFCGGPHVSNTSEIGQFVIAKESSISNGVRRIKAIIT